MTAGAVAIVLAAGSGERLGKAEPKAFLEVAGTPMVVRAAEAAAACPAVASLVVTVPRGYERTARTILAPGKPVVVVAGGNSRHSSVTAAVAEVPDRVSFVVCHDAARPFASPQQFVLVLGALDVTPDAAGAIPVVPVTDTVKRVRGGFVVRTEGSPEGQAVAQTPPAFHAYARQAFSIHTPQRSGSVARLGIPRGSMTATKALLSGTSFGGAAPRALSRMAFHRLRR